MGVNKKLFGYYPTTPEWLPIKVDSAGKVVISNIPAHKTSHENAGSDEISVLGLSGLLADGQTPLAHKTSHQDVGSDEISVLGLSGLLADSQTPLAHKTSHQDGGSDELDVTGLAGLGGFISYTDTRSKIIISTRDLAAASGDVAYTGVGFTPTSIQIIACVDGEFGFSVAVVDSTRTAVTIETTGSGVFGHNTYAVVLFVGSTANVQYCSVKSFDADGFTLTWVKGGSPTGTGYIKFLCFR